MKKILAYSCVMLASLFLLSMTSPVEDIRIIRKKQFKKTIEKDFSISSNGLVGIINKYGNIDMHTWDKDEVSFKIDIVVNATSESVADDVFETIDIVFNDTKKTVSAETVIESKGDYWWNWGRNLKSDFEINYTVYMPESCAADFFNKYGDVDMMDLKNDARLNVQYGNLTMGDLDGDLDIILSYGKAYVGIVRDVNAEVKYSNKLRIESLRNFMGETKYSGMAINSAEKIVLESKYDNHSFGHVGELVNEGKYDNFIIEHCDDLTVETKYSDIKIAHLERSLSAELNYGGLHIKDLKKGFDRIYVESDYAGIYINPGENTSFDLDLESKYVDVIIPKDGQIKEDKDGSQKSISAKYRRGDSIGKITLEMEYGQLKIK